MCVDLKGWKGLGKAAVCGCVVTRFQCYVYTTGFEVRVALRVPTVVCFESLFVFRLFTNTSFLLHTCLFLDLWLFVFVYLLFVLRISMFVNKSTCHHSCIPFSKLSIAVCLPVNPRGHLSLSSVAIFSPVSL